MRLCKVCSAEKPVLFGDGKCVDCWATAILDDGPSHYGEYPELTQALLDAEREAKGLTNN